MKNLLKINGAQALSKSELKQINGGTECNECIPGVPAGSIMGCSVGFRCIPSPDGCHYCEC